MIILITLNLTFNIQIISFDKFSYKVGYGIFHKITAFYSFYFMNYLHYFFQCNVVYLVVRTDTFFIPLFINFDFEKLRPES